MPNPTTSDAITDAGPQVDTKQQQDDGGKSGWTPPASQDDLNRIIAERVARERAKFAGFDDLKTKASEYDKLQEANKTELEKLTEQLATAQRQVTAAKREAFAATKGVPASLITGTTPDEWEAAALEALAWKGDPKTPSAGPADWQGKVGAPIAPQDIDTEIQAAQQAGDWRRAMSLTNTKLAPPQ